MNVLPGGWSELARTQVVQVTLVVLVVGSLACGLGRRRPHLACLLWMLVMVKCLTPPLWSSPTGVFSWVASRVEWDAREPDPARQPADLGPERFPPAEEPSAHSEQARQAPRAGAIAPARRGIPGAAILTIGWLAGLAILAGIVATGKLAWVLRLRRSRLPTDRTLASLLDDLSHRLSVRCKVRLLVTREPWGPAVFGLLRPTLLVPQRLVAEAPAARLEKVLAHEIIHVRRGDLAMGLLQLVTQLVWWFHPLVWWAGRQASRQRERCCDRETLAALRCDPAEYAQSLLDVLRLRRLCAAPALPGVRPIEITSRRLEEIMDRCGTFPRRTPRWCWAITLALAAVILPGQGLVLRGRASVAAGVRDDVEVEDRAVSRRYVDAFADPRGPGFTERLTLCGRLTTDEDLPELERYPRLKELDLSGSVVTDAGLAHLRGLTGLEVLRLRETRVTGSGLRHLAGLSALRELNLAGTPLTENGLSAVAGFPRLETLCLDDTQPTDAGLGHLKGLTSLRWLTLGGRQLTDAGLGHLAGLTALETLGIRESPITDDGMVHLKGLKRLKRLRLVGSRLTDAGLRHLKVLTGLEELWLFGAKITDAGLADLAALGQLRVLILEESQVTGPGLEHLGRLGRLENLHLEGNPIFDAGLRYLKGPASLRHLSLTGTQATVQGMVPVVEAIPQLRIESRDGELKADGLHARQMTDARLRRLAGATSLPGLWLRESKVTDAGLEHLHELTGLKHLDLGSAPVGDAGMKWLAPLRALETLRLSGTRVTNAGLTELAGLTALRALSFGPHATDATLSLAEKFPNLEDLTLRGEEISDAGLARLEALPRLRGLSLAAGKATDAGLAHLKNLPALRGLYVEGQFDGRGLAHLNALSNLESLDLVHWRENRPLLRPLTGLTRLKRLYAFGFLVTDAELAQLEKLVDLESLTLGTTDATDVGLKHLQGLRRLESISLASAQVTDAGAQWLRRTFPAAEVDVYGPKIRRPIYTLRPPPLGPQSTRVPP